VSRAVVVDAVVVGAGPNGLTAAVELARAGLTVQLYEAADTVGGGARTEELTLPGFRHDSCSAVHPFGIGSPAFRALPLADHGLEWLQPDLPMAHPFPDGTAAVLGRGVGETAASLGPRDAGTYRRLLAPYAGHWDTLAADFFRPAWAGLPRDPYRFVRLGLTGTPPAALLARRFHGQKGRALIAGLAGHAISRLTEPFTGAMALLFLLAAHDRGWPVARGGSQAISDALAGVLTDLGGEIRTGVTVRKLDELPPARAYVFDTSPTALARIADLGDVYRRYRYGPSVFKIDYALDGPVPWTAPAARRAGTVHLGPTYTEIGDALSRAVSGRPPQTPFLITSQLLYQTDTTILALLSVAISVLSLGMSVVGWWIVHHFSSRRDLANERRKLRVSYLLDAYRRLESASNRTNMTSHRANFESAVADIQLLGSPRQVALARQFAHAMARDKTAPLDELIEMMARWVNNSATTEATGTESERG